MVKMSEATYIKLKNTSFAVSRCLPPSPRLQSNIHAALSCVRHARLVCFRAVPHRFQGLGKP